jgi:hypothetical protein
MDKLLKELEAVAELDARATPGKVELHTSYSWRRIMADHWQSFLVPGTDTDRHPNMDSDENAQFVVALVNWYRTHHAEIAEAVKAMDRVRMLPAKWRDIANAEIGDAFSGPWDTCADELESAMHNSAREG